MVGSVTHGTRSSHVPGKHVGLEINTELAGSLVINTEEAASSLVCEGNSTSLLVRAGSNLGRRAKAGVQGFAVLC